MNSLVKIQQIMLQSGAYRCPHFEIQQVGSKQKSRACCNQKGGSELVPVCGLINNICPGLANCPRLDLQTKSSLIQAWTSDLAYQHKPNPTDYIKR
jgi:hypothetical protein